MPLSVYWTSVYIVTITEIVTVKHYKVAVQMYAV